MIEQQLYALAGGKFAASVLGVDPGLSTAQASFIAALFEGFENVFHLKGGILKYLEVIQPNQSLWQGSCFVFDEREGLGHGLDITGLAD